MFGKIFFLFFLFVIEIQAFAQNFVVNTMPEGSNITLPPAVNIISSPDQELLFAATDKPQSLKISLVDKSTLKYSHQNIKLKVIDRLHTKSRTLSIKKNDSVIYVFKKLNSVRIKPELDSGRVVAPGSGLELHISSDKPVLVSRRSLVRASM